MPFGGALTYKASLLDGVMGTPEVGVNPRSGGGWTDGFCDRRIDERLEREDFRGHTLGTRIDNGPV